MIDKSGKSGILEQENRQSRKPTIKLKSLGNFDVDNRHNYQNSWISRWIKMKQNNQRTILNY